jgi:hypothetical protein
MTTKIVTNDINCDCNSNSSIRKTKKNRSCCGCCQLKTITPTAIVNNVAAKIKASQDSTPSRRRNRVLDQDQRSRSTKMKPQVLDLKASVSPKKKPPGGKMNQKAMTAPPAVMTVAKKGKRQERNSLLSPAKRCG